MTPYLKAVTAALVAGLGSLSVAWSDSHLTGSELVTAVIAFLVALGGVWAVPNSKAKG